MVEIELDRTRHVQYGLASIRELENSLDGKPLARIINDLRSMGIDALIVSLYHGLKKEDPTLNVNLLLKIIQKYMDDGNSLQPLYRAVSKALDDTGVFRTSEDVSEGKQETPTPA